jgi:cyanophycin synthetase
LMKLLDARRLTGPNLQTRRCAALAEVSFETDDDVELALAHWCQALEGVRQALPFPIEELTIRRFDGGAALLCDTSIDALYSALVMVEWSVASTVERLGGPPCPDVATAIAEACETYKDEESPAMRALEAAAAQRGVPFLWDDDEVSVGYGAYSLTWPREELPVVDDVDWEGRRAVPVVVVTGTNGKTTTSRIATRIFKEAGHTVGNSSTDGLSINESVVDAGDWTGPGAARAILRHGDVTAAVLEAARGGILRRGMGVEVCDAAFVTNVSDDHLGEYGINDVDGMAEVKSVVFGIVGPSGYRVINCDDPRLARMGEVGDPRSIFIATQPHPKLQEHIDKGGRALFWEDGAVHVAQKGERSQLIEAESMPLARGGAARHDISNALGATALAWAAGVAWEPILRALETFGVDSADNPGRGRVLDVDGVSLLLDFGHNPHGADAILSMVRSLAGPEARIGVTLAQAGDRNDAAFRDFAYKVAEFSPARVFVRDLPEKYLRGRTLEEMFDLFFYAFTDRDVPGSAVQRVVGEVGALEAALDWARPGDWVVHLVHLEREAVLDLLTSRGGDVSA